MEWLSHVTVPNVAAAAAIIVLTRIAWQVTSNLLFSPVPSTIPGPFIARLTSTWILFVDLSGYRGRTVDALHKKYGPVVRLAPNELSFSALSCIGAIYGNGSTCIKSPAYDNFGREGMFQMQEPDRHRERQKRIAHIFAPALLQQMEPLVQNCVAKLVAQLKKRTGKEVDALHWCRMTVLDVGGELMLGKSFGALDGDGKAPTYVQRLDNAYITWSLYGLNPWLYRLFECLPIKSLQEFMAAGEYVYKYGDDAMKDYIRRYGRKSNQRSLLTKMLTGDPGTGIEPLTDAEISVEVSNLIFAATDTTGNTITYALYELCCHPEWQKKLREEIRASGAIEAGFSYQSVQSLPILNGVFTETLRLHPAAPSALPRITTGNGCRIGDLDVPGGVINLYAFPFPVSAAGVRTDSLQTLVSMQPFTVQRDPKYFSDPDKFSPDRWVSNGEIEHGSPDVREMMIPWGRGPRTCIGKHMATMESKISLARMIADFEVQLAGEKTHDEMVMTDHFTLIPKGQRCGLIFSEV